MLKPVQPLPQHDFNKLLRAIIEFQMIQEGDRILLGVSGGKDSLFLAYALSELKKRIHTDFTVEVITVNPMFKDSVFPIEQIRSYIQHLHLTFHTIDVDIAGLIASTPEKSPCFTCAFFRRGAINRFAKEHDFNKIAYAHHNDDAVETFFMGLLYSGQIHTFTPNTYLDRSNLTVIRPLVYFREEDIKQAVAYHGLVPIPAPCPHDGNTSRQTVKELILQLEQTIPNVYQHLASAMRKSAIRDLWEEEKDRAAMAKDYYTFIHRKSQ